MAPFIPGLQLSQAFYWEVVRPILAASFPGLAHAAGLIDGGSEVLGFDDVTSTDHNWGPRLQLFLTDEDFVRHSDQVRLVLADALPYEFKGYPTNFSLPDPERDISCELKLVHQKPVNHHISIQTVRSFFVDYLGFEIGEQLEPADWLTFSEQCLRTITRGIVFDDTVGLNQARARFRYYPQDIWLYLMAAGWTRLGQEEHLMGRAGMVGDEIGSALIGARLARDIMRLGFMQEKSYAPYSKWFGSAFKQLTCAETLWPVLQEALSARNWQAREGFLVQAFEIIAANHNALQVTEPLPAQVTYFHGRPFRVIAQNGFAGALLKQIPDPRIKQIAQRSLIGSLDLLSDNVDLVSDPSWRGKLRQLFE
jgi:hypothetical protein